jgi:hypothetical protein
MRIRSIKPEFWASEDIAALDWPTRLLFIGLWSYVDDNGVGRDNEKLIKSSLFPLEDDSRDPRETLATVSRGLRNLSEGDQITRYTVDGKPFLYVNAWESHQRIDKPNKARYPAPTCGNAVIRDTLATPSRVSRDTLAPGTEEQRSRGTGEELPRASARDTDPILARFDEFWDAYSHKVGRRKAETAYKVALRKPGVTADLLIASAAAYIDWQKSERKHPQFTKHAATWLTGEHWRDERVATPPARTRFQEHLALVEQLGTPETNPLQIGPAS